MTWEVPLAVSVAVVLLLALAAHVGRAVANVLAGHPWQLPPRTGLFTSLPGLLHGDATAGLGNLVGPVAGPHLLWGCIAATEAVVAVAVLWVGKQALDRWGPSRLRGMASVPEVERLLGRGRLRANRAVIRPDLYGRRAHRTRRARRVRGAAAAASRNAPSTVGER